MYKESDIVIEGKKFWVLKDRRCKSYDVMKIGVSCSTCIASFPLTEDGLSLAMAYFNYQEKQLTENKG